MIKQTILMTVAVGLLSSCGPTAASKNNDGTGGEGNEDGTPWTLPGTANPSPDSSIIRFEAQDDNGNGMILSPEYDVQTDTFFVDNLAFDGANVYERDDQIASLGPFRLYENVANVIDPVNGNSIPQLQHKAILAVSQSGQTELAIVRTGGFLGYGFGGFVYQRRNGVTIPETGQASYSGNYAALRDFNGAGGLEYVSGSARILIDFEDYNNGKGVRGFISDQVIQTPSGVDVTQLYLDALEVKYEVPFSSLPVIQFEIGPGVVNENGEMTGVAYSLVGNEDFQNGNFYAVMSDGADNEIDAEEIVGIIVVESAHPFLEDVTVRDTGGFLVSR